MCDNRVMVGQYVIENKQLSAQSIIGATAKIFAGEGVAIMCLYALILHRLVNRPIAEREK